MSAVRLFDENFDRQEGSTSSLSATPSSVYGDSWHVASNPGVGSANKLGNNTMGHIGVLALKTGANSGDESALFLSRDFNPSSATEASVEMRYILNADFWVLLPSAASVGVRVGFAQSPFSSAFGTHGIFFEYQSASPNWQCITRNASTSTTTDSGVPVTSNQWYKLSIYKGGPSGGVGFFIDRTDVAFHSTNIPTAGGVPVVWVVTTTAASKFVYVDRAICDIDESTLIG